MDPKFNRASGDERRDAQSARVGLCLMLAAADGEISDREVAVLSARLGEILGDDSTLGELQQILEGEMRALDELGPEDYMSTLTERIPREARASALFAAVRVAAADGLAPEEREAAHEAAAAFGMTADAANVLFERALAMSTRPAFE